MSDLRRVRIFVSSTFLDMKDDRDALLAGAWPDLRIFCKARQVELIEVDMRWGISDEHAATRQTLKLCLDEIRLCRPFFIGLLGERYGWVPDEDTFTADLKEEQTWLDPLSAKSVTELEIRHGVLNNPEMASCAFFYFRDPAYAIGQGADFEAEDTVSAAKQSRLKQAIRETCAARGISLRENYPSPEELARLVLEDLKKAIAAEFPVESAPDPLARQRRNHEAYAEIRRRTYIPRPDSFEALDRHADTAGAPLVLLGDSGIGKSALLANWIEHRRQTHSGDFILQHYIGNTPNSSDHGQLISRLITEMNRWAGDLEDQPVSYQDQLFALPVSLSRAHLKAEQDGVRIIVVLDALNQLDDHDNAHMLGWLPPNSFQGALRLIVSTTPGDTLDAVTRRGWPTLRVDPLKPDEQRRMIRAYLKRFGKSLDNHRIDRIVDSPASANPLYLKTLLDDLRVTGTHHELDKRLDEYLSAPDIPSLLQQVLARYQRDYERNRPGLVGDALGLIWAARRGLTETELLRVLKPPKLAQLPFAFWSPLRAALEEALVDHSGVLNFAHDYLRTAVETAFLRDEGRLDQDRLDDLRLQLADEFERQPISYGSCDELPWLLLQTESFVRLRACLLDIDRFLEIYLRDRHELISYWVYLGEERTMGRLYRASFDQWVNSEHSSKFGIGDVALQLGAFLATTAQYAEAEPLMRLALAMDEQNLELNHPSVARDLYSLANLLHDRNRYAEAEPLLRTALVVYEKSVGPEHPLMATVLDSLANLLQETGRYEEAEPLYRRALDIYEQSFGPEHPEVADTVDNLAQLLQTKDRYAEAEPLHRRSLAIYEKNFGPDHPGIAAALVGLAVLMQETGRHSEAEPLYRRSLAIREKSFGPDHPKVGVTVLNLAKLLQEMGRYAEAERLYRHALDIFEESFGPDHTYVATTVVTLASLLVKTSQYAQAAPLLEHGLAIYEKSFGPEHPYVAAALMNLGVLLGEMDRYEEAEPLCRRALGIYEKSFGLEHTDIANALNSLASLLAKMGRSEEAEPLLHRAIAIYENSFGPEHPQVANPLYNLASLLGRVDRYKEAEPLLRRVFAIRQKSFGPEHPDVAVALEGLAKLLQAMGRHGEAESLCRRALDTYERCFGPENPEVAIALSNLALLLADMENRVVDAEPIMRRSLEILLKFTRIEGQVHSQLGQVFKYYAGILDMMGYSEQQILAILKEIAPEVSYVTDPMP